MDPLTIGIGVGSEFIGSLVGAFRGDTEPESWMKKVIPLAQPYVEKNGIPVAAYWYGYSWALLPNGQTVDLNGGLKLDDFLPVAERAPYHQQLVQAYANSIQTPVANINGVFDPPTYFWLTQPQKDADTPTIVPISTSVPGVQTSGGPVATPTGGNVLQAGFGGGMGMMGVAAMAGLLLFVMTRK